MPRLSLSIAWDEARHILARDGGLLTAVALALFVLPELVSGLVAPTIETSPTMTARVISLIAAFIGVIGQLSIIRLALGPSTTVADAIGHGFRRFPVVLGAVLLLALAIAVILIPLLAILIAAGVIDMPSAGQTPPSFDMAVWAMVVGSLFLAVKFIMTIPVASAEHVGPLAILKRTWKVTGGNYWRLFVFEILLLVSALVVLIAAQTVGGTLAHVVDGDVEPFSLSALILAVFVAVAEAAFTVFASVMLARIYVQLAGRAEAQPTVPTTVI